MMKSSRCLFSALGRQRAAKRVDLKLSKIPTEFISFDNIRTLPPRQLAYTAHLAGRLGMDNEQLWDDIKFAFLDCFDRMKPKLFTQSLLALSNRDSLLSQREISRLAMHASRRATEFRVNDTVTLLQAFASFNAVDGETLRPLAAVIRNHDSELDEKTLAALFGSLGKLRINDDELLMGLVDQALARAERFNEFEVTAIIRTMGNLSVENSRQLVTELVLKNPTVARMDMGCVSIVLHAFWRLKQRGIPVSEEAVNVMISRAENLFLGADIDILPYLLLSIGNLSVTQKHAVVWTRLAATVLRNAEKLKPTSLPVALEAARTMRNRTQENRDITVILESMELKLFPIIESFLVIANDVMKRELLASKQCRYAPWFGDMVRESLGGESGVSPSTSSKSLISIETAMHAESISDREFNYLFRLILRSEIYTSQVKELVDRFVSDLDSATVKTVARALQVSLRHNFRDHIPVSARAILERFGEVSNEDLLGVLQLLSRADVNFEELELCAFKDTVEAKIAVELELVKSYSKKNEIITAAKKLGIDHPEDLIDVWEKTLADDRVVKLGKNS